MKNWLDPEEELSQADQLRSRASLLRELGADELAGKFEAVAMISEQKAYALRCLNLPCETGLGYARRARSN